ncbi:MAG: CRP-like cAMP-activated global transcriptional regulator [Myxococcota bacterium]|nr:CRP-like cAMP-activated global transcriptional regulator [Myxococcota bacterium]
MPIYQDLLAKVSIFQNLRKDSLAQLESMLVPKLYPKESLIVSQEEAGDALFIIHSGKVKVLLYGDTGREIILTTFKRGDFFGEMSLLDNQPRSANVIAMEDSELLVLRRESFLTHLKTHHETALAILAEMSRRLRKADSVIGNLALLDVYGRVARLLLEMAQNDGEETEDGLLIRARPTQQEIASMVGTSRETVSRALNEFQRRGFIDMHGRGILVKSQHHFLEEYTSSRG